MGKTNHTLALLGIVVLGTVALSGCTPFVPTSAQESVTAAAPTPTPAARNVASIFDDQKTMVETSPIPGVVLQQYKGTGPVTLHVGPLPEGQKQLGATVICSGSADWKVSVIQEDPGWASSGCSMEGGSSFSYPVVDPTKSQTVDVNVADDVRVWLTIFATK